MRGWLSRGRFTRQIDQARVRAAIEAAERRTSGEIVVSVSRFFWGDVQGAAERTFARLGISSTRERNGVLVFIVPSRRQFVIRGDDGIHAKAGQSLWDETAHAITRKLAEGDVTGALVDGITTIGAQLAVHFPSRGERDENELSDIPDLGP